MSEKGAFHGIHRVRARQRVSGPDRPDHRGVDAGLATPGAPNVLFIVLDDTGFGQLGCYGSPIATPHEG
jgi:hypothetical protein